MLSCRLHLPYAGPIADRREGVLWVGTERTEFLTAGENGARRFSIDFIAGSVGNRLRRWSRREPLIRAVGARPGRALSVLDATPGLGRDAILLALAGCRVAMVERAPTLVALLEDALRRARRQLDHWAGQPTTVHIEFGDSRTWMESSAGAAAPQVIYLDPMFPPRSKSALVKLEMRIVREIAGEGDDAGPLFATALGAARQRVVVKRPKGAPPLSGLSPDFQIDTPSVRFDVYVTEKQPRSVPKSLKPAL